MATVTGLTKERMLEIEAASVVDGDVVVNDLILTKHDGSTINAGNVRGPVGANGAVGAQGPPGAPGPGGIPKVVAFPTVPAPTDGDVVVRTDLIGDPIYKFSDGYWTRMESGPDIFDDFSGGLGRWTLRSGPSGTVVNSGGTLTSSAIDMHDWRPAVPIVTDSIKAMVKFRVGTTALGQFWLAFGKFLDAANYLEMAIWGTPGGLFSMGCWKYDAGVQSQIGSTVNIGMVANQDYWAVFRQSGRNIAVELYEFNPTFGRLPLLASSVQALAGANLTKYGPGIAVDWQLEWQPPAAVPASNYMDEITVVTIPSIRSQF